MPAGVEGSREQRRRTALQAKQQLVEALRTRGASSAARGAATTANSTRYIVLGCSLGNRLATLSEILATSVGYAGVTRFVWPLDRYCGAPLDALFALPAAVAGVTAAAEFASVADVRALLAAPTDAPPVFTLDASSREVLGLGAQADVALAVSTMRRNLRVAPPQVRAVSSIELKQLTARGTGSARPTVVHSCWGSALHHACAWHRRLKPAPPLLPPLRTAIDGLLLLQRPRAWRSSWQRAALARAASYASCCASSPSPPPPAGRGARTAGEARWWLRPRGGTQCPAPHPPSLPPPTTVGPFSRMWRAVHDQIHDRLWRPRHPHAGGGDAVCDGSGSDAHQATQRVRPRGLVVGVHVRGVDALDKSAGDSRLKRSAASLAAGLHAALHDLIERSDAPPTLLLIAAQDEDDAAPPFRALFHGRVRTLRELAAPPQTSASSSRLDEPADERGDGEGFARGSTAAMQRAAMDLALLAASNVAIVANTESSFSKAAACMGGVPLLNWGGGYAGYSGQGSGYSGGGGPNASVVALRDRWLQQAETVLRSAADAMCDERPSGAAQSAPRAGSPCRL